MFAYVAQCFRFQGFLPPLSKGKPPVSSLRQHPHSHTVRPCTSLSSVFDCVHIPFTCPALPFLPIGHRHSFRVQAYSLLWLPFFQHHNLFNKHHQLFSHSQSRPNIFTTLLRSSVHCLVVLVEFLTAPSCSSQRYVLSNPSLSNATLEARASHVYISN